MILFFVGIIEMAISAWWTRSVAKADVVSTGAITGVHLLIWYFVLEQVMENIHDWSTIAPYMVGCMAGAMLGVADQKRMKKRLTKLFRVRGRKARKKAPSAAYPTVVEYEHLG